MKSAKKPNKASSILDQISKTLEASRLLLVSTFPRGGTQIVQPAFCPESMLRPYVKGLHTHDQATWAAILRRKPVNAGSIWSGGVFADSDYLERVMTPVGLRYLAAAPVAAPLLAGYPGAIQVYRTEGQGDFTGAELKTLGKLAGQFDEACAARRPQLPPTFNGQTEDTQGCVCRQFIFGNSGQITVYPCKIAVDAQLARAMRQAADEHLSSAGNHPYFRDRVELGDSVGQTWAFRCAVYPTYPALGKGPFVFFCLQPSSAEWVMVQPSELQADPELDRLVPTLPYMRDRFVNNPGLLKIAAKAKLSPFHFHRRFTELMGETPKHFMLDCQIEYAKKLLWSRKVPLIKIAKLCGFAHQSHFTSRFKQTTGLTPTRWRRLAGDKRRPAEKLIAQRTPGCTV